MKKLRLFPVLAATIVAMLLAPISALAADNSAICHRPDSVRSDNPGWKLLTVSSRAVDRHLGHGDGVPGGEVPGSDGELTFDDTCQPQPVVEGGDEGELPAPAEVIFALAYIDVDGNHEYGSGDVLISKMVDGPSPYDDGVPGAGDLIVTDRYPTESGTPASAAFGITEHTVTSFLPQPSGCLAATATGSFSWTESSTVENYEERTSATRVMSYFRDAIATGMDALVANPGSPSAPSVAVSGGGPDVTDGSFLEVEVSCSTN